MYSAPTKIKRYGKVVYTKERWELLKSLRMDAIKLIKCLELNGITSFAYGSVARGDVDKDSDVEVFIPYQVASHQVETALLSCGFRIVRRVLTQATPSYVVKAYVYVNESTSVSFPLIKMKVEEEAFYDLAGKVYADDIIEGIRRPGINKDLLAIIPIKEGHIEFPVRDRIEEVAKMIGVKPETLRSRVRILLRRREVGKTGVYRNIEIDGNVSFEEILERMVSENPILRKRIRETGY